MDDDALTHSIAVCNLNMDDTLERSLRSMADQVDPERYEVVVVDGGSTDGSRRILRRLDAEYDHLRAVLDRSDEANWLGGDRNISFEESRGEYVLESLDTDDRYFDGVIEDFVTIYHELEAAIDRNFFLSGRGINMAPRQLLLNVPYYDLGGAEDRDFWRRLYHRDALIWLDHGPVSEEIGYHMDLRDRISRDLHGKVTDFQSGISFCSCMAWTLHHEHYYILEEERPLPLEVVKRLYDLVTFPYAYLKSLPKAYHAAPQEFRQKGSLERKIAETRMTLPELEAEYGFAVDREALSEAGRRAFLQEP